MNTTPLQAAALGIARYHNPNATRGNSSDTEKAKAAINGLWHEATIRLDGIVDPEYQEAAVTAILGPHPLIAQRKQQS